MTIIIKISPSARKRRLLSNALFRTVIAMLSVMIFHKHKLHQHKVSKKKMTSIDKLMYFASFAYPFTAIPQIIQVYTSKDVTSLSLLSFALYVLFGSIFLAYAASKKLKPLIIEGALWLLIYIAMLIGIVAFS